MAKVPYSKPALNYADQISQLKARHLHIDDDNKALHLLQTLSYYRLSGYWYPMIKEPKYRHLFKDDSKFSNAFKLYCFDRELKQLVMGDVEKIEIAVRAKMIYIMAMTHGAFWYLDKNLFIDPAAHGKTIKIIEREYKRSDETFIKNFNAKYSDPFPPSWMILEVISFGTLVKLYDNLLPSPTKLSISACFGIDEPTFSSWINSFVSVRNLCAHHARFWNKKMNIHPLVPTTTNHMFITNFTAPHRIPGRPNFLNNQRVYFLASVLIYILNTINPNHSFKEKLHKLLAKYPMIDTKAMGFPDGWESESLWNWKRVCSNRKWYRRYWRYLKKDILLYFETKRIRNYKPTN